MSIGIDLGANKLAIVDLENEFFVVYQRRKPRGRGQDLLEMRRWLEAQTYIGERDAFVEAPVLAGVRNIQSTIKIAQTSGLVQSVLARTHETAVSSWKKGTVGSGNATKTQVRDWLDATYPEIAWMCRGNQDLYDAACIALYGVTQLEAAR